MLMKTILNQSGRAKHVPDCRRCPIMANPGCTRSRSENRLSARINSALGERATMITRMQPSSTDGECQQHTTPTKTAQPFKKYHAAKNADKHARLSWKARPSHKPTAQINAGSAHKSQPQSRHNLRRKSRLLFRPKAVPKLTTGLRHLQSLFRSDPIREQPWPLNVDPPPLSVTAKMAPAARRPP